MSKGLIIGGGLLFLLVIIGLVVYFTMGGGKEKPVTISGPSSPGPAGPGPAGPGPAGPAPPSDPCAGLVDTSLASSIPVSCLRKLLTDEGCTDQGTVWPGDDYNGWWRQSPQGTTAVSCDNQGTPCGAGNFGVVKSDIHAWATMTDPTHVAGCGRST